MKRKILLILALCFFLLPALFYGCQEEKSSVWDLLQKLVLIPGVSGFEGGVADFIQQSFPLDIAAERDEMNNIWFSAGSGEPHLLFVAHTDELGLVVTQITAQGTLKVKGRGGFFPLTYEGHPVVVYTKNGPVEGVVSPRRTYMDRDVQASSFQIEDIEVYLGVSDEQGARSLGISEGDQITIKKKIVNLSSELIATRAVDDRAGCAALMAAAARIDWKSIKGKTITFAWDVQEETGLYGASRLAEKLKVDYVFPVDTFVSSDGPFDPKRFAFLPLGKGAVLRAVDSSSITPHDKLQKVLQIARRHGIPIQVGNTRGGNDGSVFLPEGAVDIPLSWPGTYSHSFIEKIHRKDLEALTDLIAALVKDF
jgi:putative aminopeptidase FrvX